MLRGKFEQELRRLQDEVIDLGSEVEENLTKVVKALQRRDMTLSLHLIEADREINRRRINIGMDCLTLIATQQPIAGDMRLIAGVIEIVGELERIHDYIKGIAKISIMMGEVRLLDALVELMPQMAEKARHMLHRALDAFIESDAELARRIPATDDEVDALYNQAYQVIIDYVTQNPRATEHANRLEWAAHNLERSADRVTNICEWVVYIVDGEYTEMDRTVEIPLPPQPQTNT